MILASKETLLQKMTRFWFKTLRIYTMRNNFKKWYVAHIQKKKKKKKMTQFIF